MSIGSPLAMASDEASAFAPSCPSAPTACSSAAPKSAPLGFAVPAPLVGSLGEIGEKPPIPESAIQMLPRSLCPTQVDRPLGHLLDRVEDRHVGLVGAACR